MVAPVVIAAAIGAAGTVIGAISNYMSTSNGLEQQQRMQAQATAEEKAAIAQALDILEQMGSPDYNGIQRLPPQLLQVVGKYFPEIPALVEEKAPELIAEADSYKEKQYQQDVLNQLQQQATGRDTQAEAEQAIAQQQAAAAGASTRAGILRDMASRGAGGTGTELMASLQSAQQEEAMNRQSALQSQINAQQRRRQALGDLMAGATNVRGQNLNVEDKNKNTINAFNERMAMNRNKYNQYKAELQNKAQLANLENEQNIANANVGIQNADNEVRYKEEVRRAIEKASLGNEKLTNRANAITKQGASTAQALNESGKAAAQAGINQGILLNTLATSGGKLGGQAVDAYTAGNTPAVNNSAGTSNNQDLITDDDSWKVSRFTQKV